MNENGYMCFYRGKSIEVWAETSLKAQEIAATKFKAKKSYEIVTVLCERSDGTQVTTTITS